MILLDTNVVSGLMKSESKAAIGAWLDTQRRNSVWTSAITVFEIRMGIELLPPSRRRQALEDTFARAIDVSFAGRIASFDEAAAQTAGKIAAGRQQIGRSLDVRDLRIAGIAIARDAALATGNIRHFEGLGIELIDPWAA
ncbi:MAG TPA: type II toxin-antitoxin system VapC family toxin [Thermoanaerobaculia bacterium]|nr:type II toxin-antitoxin system VapC family toxin [Thermoanaerobaculia bacterium]